MKSSANNSPLDNFIQETLKSPDTDLHPFDWSEIEVLLRHEQKSISAGARKKTILISSAAVIIVMGVFGIFKIIQHYSSLPAETETLIDPTQNTFSIIDTQKNIADDSAVSMMDTAKIDSSRVALDEEHKTDSILAASDALLKNIKDKPSADAARIIQKQDKKQKQNNTKTVNPPVDTAMKIITPPADTVKIIPPIEIKTEVPLLDDTVNKNNPAPKKNSKSKKSKSQKDGSPPPTNLPKSESPAETKPDSLKQQ